MKNKLVKGTIILTAAGIITRIIGFIYRIFLAGALGETDLGIYQLIFPVYSICFTIYAAGIQTAVSQMISHERRDNHPGILKSGIFLSLIAAFTLSLLLSLCSRWIGIHFLGSAETIELLQVLALIFPFCGVTSVINGYFYGISEAGIPAVTQIIEQLFRVFFVVGISFLLYAGTLRTTLAVAGLIAGEAASNIYNVWHLLRRESPRVIWKSRFQIKKMLALSVPLSANKLVISLLGSVESVLIPAMLVRYGYSDNQALALFGILTGIVLPFILFPGTITNSLSVLLLPAISHAIGREEHQTVRQTTAVTSQYSILLGVLASSLFLNFGRDIGHYIFQSENAGKLLCALALLCPFLYVSTTLTSVINGLGKTGITFFHTVVGLSIRIFFLVFVTPECGIYGYLLGMTLSQITLCLLNAVYLIRKYHITLSLMNHFVWPMIFCCSIFYLAKLCGQHLQAAMDLHPLWQFVFLIPAALVILLYMWRFRLISLFDFKK